MVVPFSEYLLYFDMHTRQLLQSVVDLLGALHHILFVVYMVVLIGQRTEENSAIPPPERRTRAGERPALCHERAAESLRCRRANAWRETRERNVWHGNP